MQALELRRADVTDEPMRIDAFSAGIPDPVFPAAVSFRRTGI
ncbi:hypothetical protein ASZ90_010115 [hydrocarbon metagenome]|uniref:Uncharacterized protein n=1 Tax=hydrocarbon metagenome TaxID=938273 RepID=A0A0W8FH41_9ZZZZ